MAEIKDIIKNQKRRVLVIGVSIILVFFAIVIFSDYGLLNRFKLEYKRITLSREIDAKLKVSDSLKNEIELLKSDPAAIERIAREKYGMKRKNEEVFYLPREKK
ncbi:MAG: septum formation initiator family protein [Candidatus Kapabacteria bacterium]|jgi:cell division protein FtsB|nr:septum formation initiator family protein [Candidatus Kapabacteria bacterium]